MKTRMNCIGCAMLAEYKRADIEHHIVYRWEDLRAPLCDICHFHITALNTYEAQVLKHKLTDDERWRLWRKFCEDSLGNLSEDSFIVGCCDPACSAILRAQVDAMKSTLQRLNIGGETGEQLVKYIDSCAEYADWVAAQPSLFGGLFGDHNGQVAAQKYIQAVRTAEQGA